MMYPLGTQSSTEQDRIFEAQQNIMKFLVERESCIIVGRCSDFVLSDEENAVHIYIYAPYEQRVKNCVNDLHLSEEEAKKMIRSALGIAMIISLILYFSALCRISSIRP